MFLGTMECQKKPFYVQIPDSAAFIYYNFPKVADQS